MQTSFDIELKGISPVILDGGLVIGTSSMITLAGSSSSANLGHDARGSTGTEHIQLTLVVQSTRH